MLHEIPVNMICNVISVYDGDTFKCSSGVSVRASGIDSNELSGKCHHACAAMSATQSRDWLRSRILGTIVTCQPVGKSYQRVVARCRFADGQDLACASVAAGASVVWDVYWRRLRMGFVGDAYIPQMDEMARCGIRRSRRRYSGA